MQDQENIITETQNFTLRFYFQTLTRLLKEPRNFFSEMPSQIGWKTPFCFLSLSSIIYAVASVMNGSYPNPLLMGGIFFINAVGMVLIVAALGYMVMVMTMGKRMTFINFFSIYAFSSGVTLLASWLPFFLIITEPWKWWLIGIGMMKKWGFTLGQAITVIALSLGLLILLFYSLLPFFPKLS